MKKVISTQKAPAAIGPYSQGIVAGPFLYASGQIPIDPATGEIKGEDILEQTEQVMKNVGAILEEAGYRYEDVVKTTCFLADMGDFATFNGMRLWKSGERTDFSRWKMKSTPPWRRSGA